MTPDPTTKPKTVSEIVTPSDDPNLRRILVDGKRVATLSPFQVEQLGISAGCAWTDELAGGVERLHRIDKARRIALDLLARRGRSESELTARLARRGVEAEVTQIVVAEMIDQHWVNDVELASQIIEQLLRTGPCRPPLARQKLQARGLTEDIIEGAVHTAFDTRDDAADAIEAARLRLGKMGDANGAVAARRIAGYLARRGFEEDAIAAAIDHLGLLPEP